MIAATSSRNPQSRRTIMKRNAVAAGAFPWSNRTAPPFGPRPAIRICCRLRRSLTLPFTSTRTHPIRTTHGRSIGIPRRSSIRFSPVIACSQPEVDTAHVTFARLFCARVVLSTFVVSPPLSIHLKGFFMSIFMRPVFARTFVLGAAVMLGCEQESNTPAPSV